MHRDDNGTKEADIRGNDEHRASTRRVVRRNGENGDRIHQMQRKVRKSCEIAYIFFVFVDMGDKKLKLMFLDCYKQTLMEPFTQQGQLLSVEQLSANNGRFTSLLQFVKEHPFIKEGEQWKDDDCEIHKIITRFSGPDYENGSVIMGIHSAYVSWGTAEVRVKLRGLIKTL